MLHYFATHFYNRTLISPHIDYSNISVYLINETPASQRTAAPSEAPMKKVSQKSKWHQRIMSGNSVLDKMHKGDDEMVFSMEQGEREQTVQGSDWTVEVTMYSWANQKPLKTWTQHIDKVGLLYIAYEYDSRLNYVKICN